jgi:hypothetical protein
MLRETSEKVVARYLFVGSAAVTLVVFTQGITDPVNVTKFFLIGGLAFGLIAATNLKSLFTLISTNRTALLSLGLFLAGSLNSLATSSAPFSQTLYGVYGRNNGFLLYFFLVLIFIVTLSISKDESFSSILKSLALAGCLNVIYCLWVIVFGDFIGWSNPYGNILGTLGNPNFIGAFLGMFSSLVFTWMIQMRGDKVKLSLICSLQALVIFEIYQSHAIQGRVLLVAGFFVNVFYLIRSHHIFKRFAIPLILSGSTIAILAVI